MKLQFYILGLIANTSILAQPDNISRLMQNSNFYFITRMGDSLLYNNSDSLNDGEYVHYLRWKWFWSTRVDSIFSSDKGKFSYYLNSIKSYPLFHTSIPCNINGQWSLLGPGITPHYPQELGIVVSGAVDPFNSNIIYLGTNASGLWKTTNAHSQIPSWVNITDNLNMPGLGIQDILIDYTNSNIIYIATGISTFGRNYGIGILKSIDGGNSWNIILSINPSQLKMVRKLAMHPSNPNIIYAAVEDALYKTTDGGNTWSLEYTLPNSIGQNPYNPNAPARVIRDIAIHPINPNTIYLATDNTGLNS